MKLSQKTKSELFLALLKENDLFSYAEKNDLMMDLLSETWNLRAMPSEDNRFTDAYQDIVQHTINNDDWDLSYLFIERLKLFNEDSVYKKFLESIVKIKYRESEDEVMKFVLLINSYIESEELTLLIYEYDDNERAIYSIQKIEDKNSFVDIAKNKIPFYLVKEPNGRSNNFSSHTPPDTRPAFALVFNNAWNDYGKWTTFSLFFYGLNNQELHLGETKITNGDDTYTTSALPDKFETLPESFCSLGQSFIYYQNLKSATGKYFESILFALRDAAFFPDVHDHFDRNHIFINSLIREDEAEKQLREAKHKIYKYDLNNLYGFKYYFNPKYSEDTVEIAFDFTNNSEVPNRVFAIIGKNGTGKTQLITRLPLDISEKNNDNFTPRPPLFSKVIAVSYSIFDDFEIPKKTSIFNYVYCGLHNINNGKREILSPRQQVLRFHNTWKKIKSLDRMNFWRNVLLKFIDEEIINGFIIEEDDSSILTVSIDGFNKEKVKLSSGQNIILYIISEIISHIRFNSLILFDEPETHLHPNAISQLMNVISDLTNNFDSYCIITTHSPLIVQGLLSRNVYIMDRHEYTVSIRKIGLESFGENLTNLTEEVFGNKEIDKQYKIIIDKLVFNKMSYEDIIEKLESDNIPLSLNARLYIKSKVN